jgi:hypothetical protein
MKPSSITYRYASHGGVALNGLRSSFESRLVYRTIEVDLSVVMKFIISRSPPVIGPSY